MKKMMLIFEDIQESDRIKADLQKIGFDVQASKSLVRLSDQLLNFNPDIVIGCGTHKFSSISVGQKLKEAQVHLQGKVILVLQKGERPAATELVKTRVDVFMEAPVKTIQLIETVARLLEFDPAPLLEKFNKSQIQEHAPPPTPRLSKDNFEADKSMFTVRGNGLVDSQKVALEDKKRVDAYQKFVQDMHIDTHQTSHSRATVRARQEELKKGWDRSLLEELDKLRRQFAQALFKKNN
jgi:FixJ family two-component response regulator